MRYIRWVMLLSCLLAAAGCAVTQRPVEVQVDTTQNLPDQPGWRHVRFRIAREAGEAPRWYIGDLVGGEVIAPVFDRYHSDILIWRIHRRAGEDAYGHVQSFIFYSTPQGAQRIYTAIRSSPVLADLQARGRVTWVGYDDLRQNDSPDVDDTSDSNWSAPVRRTWPALIMGASRMWLDLVSELAAAHADEADLEKRYQLVQQDINNIWANEGQHAILHHISAVFAYQPLLIRY